MIQKLDDGRKVAILRVRHRILPSRFGLDDRVKENFESMCEENQVLVVRREGDRLLYLAGCQMKTQNVMQEQMRLKPWLGNSFRTRLIVGLHSLHDETSQMAELTQRYFHVPLL